MSLFRDIKSINYPGGSTANPGCAEVSLEVSGDEIEHSACDDLAIRYRGLTGLAVTAEATMRGLESLGRDLKAVTLAGVAIPDATSVTATLTANEMSDSSDDDSWLTYLGVTGRSLEVTVTTRSIDLAGTAGLQMGCVGAFTASVLLGAVSGCPAGTNEGAPVSVISASSLMVTNIAVSATHGDFAELTITAKGTGLADNWTSTLGMTNRPGKTDVFGFSVIDATTVTETGGGSVVSFTLENAVLMENSLTLTHGEMMEQSFSVKAFSSDGQTTPLTVSGG